MPLMTKMPQIRACWVDVTLWPMPSLATRALPYAVPGSLYMGWASREGRASRLLVGVAICAGLGAVFGSAIVGNSPHVSRQLATLAGCLSFAVTSAVAALWLGLSRRMAQHDT